MTRRLFSTAFLLMIGLFTVAQEPNTREVPLNVLVVVDSGLEPILDNIIETESGRNYYYPGAQFEIEFSTDGKIMIRLTGKTYYYDDLYLGVLKYKGHNFLVRGNELDCRIFEHTKNNEKIGFWIDSYYINEKTGKPVFVLVLDDGMSMWFYKYNSEGFDLIQFFNTKRD